MWKEPQRTTWKDLVHLFKAWVDFFKDPFKYV